MGFQLLSSVQNDVNIWNYKRFVRIESSNTIHVLWNLILFFFILFFINFKYFHKLCPKLHVQLYIRGISPPWAPLFPLFAPSTPSPPSSSCSSSLAAGCSSPALLPSFWLAAAGLTLPPNPTRLLTTPPSNGFCWDAEEHVIYTTCI